MSWALSQPLPRSTKLFVASPNQSAQDLPQPCMTMDAKARAAMEAHLLIARKQTVSRAIGVSEAWILSQTRLEP